MKAVQLYLTFLFCVVFVFGLFVLLGGRVGLADLLSYLVERILPGDLRIRVNFDVVTVS